MKDTTDTDAVLEKICELMDGYEEKKAEYAHYRTAIANEKAEFM